MTALGIGLVDLGRHFSARIDGHDPGAQFLQSKPSCLANGVPLGAIGSEVNTQASTVCYTTHGDYRLAFVLPASGGTTLFNYGGSNAIKISGGEMVGNYIRLVIGSSGNIVTKYIQDGNIGGTPMIVGTSVPTTSGNDVTITIACTQGRIQVTIQDGGNAAVTALDIEAARFVSEQAGGTPINIGFASAPTGSPTMNITEFWEGIGYPTQQFSNYNLAMGPPGTCAPSTAKWRRT